MTNKYLPGGQLSNHVSPRFKGDDPLPKAFNAQASPDVPPIEAHAGSLDEPSQDDEGGLEDIFDFFGGILDLFGS